MENELNAQTDRAEKKAEQARSDRSLARKKKLASTGKFVLGALAVLLVLGGLVLYGESQDRATQASPLSNTVSAEDHVTGNPDARVTVIEYSDFQCPACQAYAPLMKQLYAEYGDRVRFVYRHFPLSSLHPNAIAGARAAEAASEQGKFWEFAEALFVKQDEWAPEKDPLEKFVSYASLLGLDTDAFTAAYKSTAVRDRVDADVRSGLSVGLNSTPTFFIDGKPLANPRGYEAFKKVLDEELAANATTPAETPSTP